jgi:hypothetical protein
MAAGLARIHERVGSRPVITLLAVTGQLVYSQSKEKFGWKTFVSETTMDKGVKLVKMVTHQSAAAGQPKRAS